MTIRTFPAHLADVVLPAFPLPPSSFSAMGAVADVVWEPDLSPTNATLVDDAIARAIIAGDPLSRDTYATVRAQVQTIRDLRQMGRNGFMALTAAERDRLLYDAQAATTTILLAILRE